MNFRKDRVSKAAAFVSLALALSLLAPSRSPEPADAAANWVAGAVPGRLAYAQPPRLEHRCREARGTLRFEMITDESQVQPPPGRSPVVCLAIHGLSGRD